MTPDYPARLVDPSPDGATSAVLKRARRVRADMDDGMAPLGSLEHLHFDASWKGSEQTVHANPRGVAGCELCRMSLRARREGE